MNKPKAQGTAWESEFVRRARDAGLMADRLPEGGLRDAGDVWINDTPSNHKTRSGWDIPVVAWSRLVDTGGDRRSPDGERSVVVISTDDFLKLALQAGAYAFVVECKSREKLNVTRELANAKRKLAAWKAGR